jgi:hypothetical protein
VPGFKGKPSDRRDGRLPFLALWDPLESSLFVLLAVSER